MARPKRKLIYTSEGWAYEATLPGGYTRSELDEIRPLTLEELHTWALSKGYTYTSVLKNAKAYRKECGDPLPIPKRPEPTDPAVLALIEANREERRREAEAKRQRTANRTRQKETK